MDQEDTTGAPATEAAPEQSADPKTEATVVPIESGDVFHRTVTSKLTDSETAALGHELAGNLMRLERAVADKKAEAEAATAQIKAIQAAVDRIRDEIRSGERKAQVEVRREADFGAALWRFFRIDTGEELVPEKIAEEDLQRGLFEQNERDAEYNAEQARMAEQNRPTDEVLVSQERELTPEEAATQAAAFDAIKVESGPELDEERTGLAEA